LTVGDGSTIQSRRGRRSRSAFGGSRFGSSALDGRAAFNWIAFLNRNAVTAAVISAVAHGDVAVVAVIIATAIMISMATIAAVATVAATGRFTSSHASKQALTTATITSAAAIAAVARAVAIAIATAASDGLLFTAQQSDADNREKDRDTE
jgi:hypothetical protein